MSTSTFSFCSVVDADVTHGSVDTERLVSHFKSFGLWARSRFGSGPNRGSSVDGCLAELRDLFNLHYLVHAAGSWQTLR